MARKKKPVLPNKEEIISKFMEYSCEHPSIEKNAYTFCKHYDFPENHFYKFFGSLEALEKYIWRLMMIKTIETVQKDDQFFEYSGQEKLLSVLFTFFENATLNRSFLLVSMDTHSSLTSKLKLLKPMKREFGDFIDRSFEDMRINMSRSDIKTIDDMRSVGFREGFWTQLLFLIDFWKKDESPEFEKTDIAIEKSVLAIMDCFDTNPVRSIIDLGKFVWKHKVTSQF